MTQIYWRVEGRDSQMKIYEAKVKAGCFSDNQICNLLKTLAAKHLDYGEIVGALARRKTKIANDLLAIRKPTPLPIYECGENPYFVAWIEPFDYERTSRFIHDVQKVNQE